MALSVLTTISSFNTASAAPRENAQDPSSVCPMSQARSFQRDQPSEIRTHMQPSGSEWAAFHEVRQSPRRCGRRNLCCSPAVPRRPQPQSFHRQAVSHRPKDRSRRPRSQSPCCFRRHTSRAGSDEQLRWRSECIRCISRRGYSRHQRGQRCLRWTQPSNWSRSPPKAIDRCRVVQEGADGSLPPLSNRVVRVLLLLQVQAQDRLRWSTIEDLRADEGR